MLGYLSVLNQFFVPAGAGRRGLAPTHLIKYRKAVPALFPPFFRISAARAGRGRSARAAERGAKTSGPQREGLAA